MHRLIMEQSIGRKLLPGEEIDHINGDGLNNQRSNLRIATRQENQRNMKRHSDSRSPYIGVYHNPRYNKPYTVKITIDYTNVHLGRFDTIEEAAAHRDKAVLKLFGPYVQLNFEDRRDEFLEEVKNGFDPFPPKRVYASKHPGIGKGQYNRWLARVYTDGKQIHVGSFSSEDEAVRARAEYLESHNIEDKCRIKK